MPASAYKPSANYQYNPTSPRTDRRLVLAEIQETKDEQAKYKLTNEINPGKFGLEIRGGLYAAPYKAGLWMYFARPEPSSLAAALQHPAIASKREQTVLAQSVQDEVVGPLFNSVKGINRKAASQTGSTSNDSSVVGHRSLRGARPPTSALSSRDGKPAMIQRKAKSRTVKLEDNFKYEPWKTAHMNLGRQIRGQTPTSGKPLIAKETANKLRILELAYLAEDRLAHTGKSTLPPKDQLKETIKGRATPMLLPDLVGWIWRWTSTPFQILGAFRSRFGGVFVKAVNKFTELKDSISKKVKEFFQQRAKHKGTGQSLVKALTVAIKQVVNVWFHKH